MAVVTFTDEFTSSVPSKKLFTALILDADNLIPKLMPQAFKSIETIQGNGGPGSIKKMTFAEGHQVKHVKNRIDAIDPENFSYTYSLVDGHGLLDKLETVLYEVQFLPGPDGGSINKMKSTYHTKGDVVLSDEEIKAGKEKALGMYKAVEGYLLQNPDAYA
ncbi:hypothetical protein GH714_018310 [Hevea brasiliensis]|uniref:Bet v I/Major latex protein domain-containing protein n=1 Tax=Hevea brasiliensis TaxID=3981 RepID=A0A6A6MJC6_HEVBR|nr:hypothetical protein GH714_018310 [Hevea brasiliensis]